MRTGQMCTEKCLVAMTQLKFAFALVDKIMHDPSSQE